MVKERLGSRVCVNVLLLVRCGVWTVFSLGCAFPSMSPSAALIVDTCSSGKEDEEDRSVSHGA